MEDKKNVNQPVEVNPEDLEQVSGGVQAGIFTLGGKGEFYDVQPTREETEEERKARLRRQYL